MLRCAKAEMMIWLKQSCSRQPSVVLPRERRATVQRGNEGDRVSHSGVELLLGRHEDLVSLGPEKERKK